MAFNIANRRIRQITYCDKGMLKVKGIQYGMVVFFVFGKPHSSPVRNCTGEFRRYCDSYNISVISEEACGIAL